METTNLNNMADEKIKGPSSTANAMVKASADSGSRRTQHGQDLQVCPDRCRCAPMHPRDSAFPVVKIVKKGETLSQLTQEVYGVW